MKKNNEIVNPISFDYYKKILDLIPKGYENAINLSDLVKLTNLSPREIKHIISDLRIDYPICSRETDGGGYWLTEKDSDIKEFVKMIERRRQGYDRTIEIMNNHIGEV